MKTSTLHEGDDQYPVKHPFPLRAIIRIRRYSTVELLVALVLLFVVTPFVQELPSGKVLESVLMTLVLLSGLLAVAGPRRTVMGFLFVLPALIAQWVDHFRPGLIPIPLIYGTALLFSLFVIIHLLAFVLRAPRVNFEVLCASISAYLMMGLAWMTGYVLLSEFNADAFAFNQPNQTMDGFNAFYFSFVTLSTVGFGDITPVSRGARMLTIIEAVTGMFYVTVLVARLVGLYSSAPKKTDDGDQA